MTTENPMRVSEDSVGAAKWAPPRATPAFSSSSATEELGSLLRGHDNTERDGINIAPNRSGSAPPSMEASFSAFGNNWRSPSVDGGRGSGSMYISRTSLSTTHEDDPEDDTTLKDDRTKSTSLMFGHNSLSFSARHKSLANLLQESFPRTPSPVFSQNRSSSHVGEAFNHEMQGLSLDSGIDIPTVPINPFLDTSGRSLSMHGDELISYHVSGTGLQRNINSVEMQPSPLYASTGAYMAPGTSFYPNLSTSGLYTTTPQYSGYSMDSSTFIPPYLAGYPPQTAFPLHINANSGQNLTSQTPGIPTGENFSKGSAAVQNLNRFYGQYGVTMPPTFQDPLSLQYFQQTMRDPYGVPMQYANLPSPAGQTFQFSPRGNIGIPSARETMIPGTSYLSSPTGLGFVPQFPTSPLGSPVFPQSPVGGTSTSSLGRRYDFGFSQTSPRNVGGYARWQGQREADSFSEYRKHSFLEELKTSNARRIDLSDIVGRIVEFSVDQHGSRFIQQKLENCSVQEKELVFKEVLPHASKLITDVFGNYVIQKFFEHGTYDQRKELASQLSGQMLPLSLQMYGCRVIQKALEVIDVEQKTELVLELDGHVMRCVRDQNGNHVIQKCVECMPTENIDFIISAFHGQVATLSTHPYGCRVIQRVLEHCSDDVRCGTIVDEILESASDLARDQYGNYVTQHVLERGKPLVRSQIIRKLCGKIVQMSQHKYASNVVEKCLEFGDAAEREFLIDEILLQSEENDNLLVMMKDQFANYVVQKILEISNDKQRETLLHRIRLHLIALRKYTYGKHIVARFEQLCGEDNGSTSEP
ncbi:hypothetical protein ABFS82_09G135300 [Erythranthe guttata]|uniref:pumilio homolog 5 n=1 Tax=Erythranthe guttata TaxID=4155 RepID=UPI00064DD204|nr:PREDICTED: pumilio homolog 5 [Erythranthe guttata]|eukprot:XP_012856538.1 PREDICTED: pumilio homolog 5 [Erythranthe guttata]